ncbi:hypothetical protein INT45_012705 [Circinella minor]|uniref:No apical meristem-associated C-terminal domain-containing protein n=1 Tax=Circinella minor TaxID=1195481 RepID=A0A8H7VCD9_9FUNG|nr:hypothetical protein INT45_012705 [Circinella minor]
MESNAACNITATTTTTPTATTNTTPIPIAIPSNSGDGASDSDDNDETIVGEQGRNTQKQCGSNWTDEEDLKLANAWCGVSTDPAKGAEYREQGLWEQILVTFASTSNPSSRDWKALKNRQGIISKTCSVFSAAFGLAQDKKGSGESEDDVMTCTLKIYASHPPKGSSMKFRNIHCWRILKGQHKWRVFLEKEKSRPEDVAQDPKRPMGKKKAKAMQSKKRRLEEDGDEEERVAPEVTLLQERIELDRSRFDLDRARFESMNTADDISIMDRDISTYTGARLQFFKHLQEKAMNKYFDEE